MISNKGENLFRKTTGGINNIFYVLFLDVETLIAYVDLTKEGKHLVENATPFLY